MQTIPIFPLNMVVFPGEKVNLHIFEPRYIQLIEECKENGTSFCIPFFNSNRVMPVVTEMRLVEITKVYEDGKMDVKTQATDNVFAVKKVIKKVPEKLYSAAKVESLNYIYDDKDVILAFKIQEQVLELYDFLDVNRTVPPAEDMQIFDLGHLLGLKPLQEFELLTLQTEEQRQAYINEHLKTFIPHIKEMKELQRKAKLNGHFKHLKPPDFQVHLR